MNEKQLRQLMADVEQGLQKLQLEEEEVDNFSKEVETSLVIADWLDSKFFGVGLDPIIGFFLPGVGDVITGVGSFFILRAAWRLKVPYRCMAEMLWNLILDSFGGFIPFIGDAVDVVWRANQKNAKILKHCISTGRVLQRDYTWREFLSLVGLASFALIVAIAAAVFAVVKVVGFFLWLL